MYQIITWGSYDDYRIIKLIKTNKDLNELSKKFHQIYNIPWDDDYIPGDYGDGNQRKAIRKNLRNDGFTINYSYKYESEFVNAFIQWLVIEHQVEIIEYKETRFDRDPDDIN